LCEGTSRGGTCLLRLDFPGYTGADSLERIDWDQWFEQFDRNNLVLLVQDATASGEQSNFNKLVSARAWKASSSVQKRGLRIRTS